jgi:DNA-binding NarL/FixJ family response regulator
MKENIKIAIAEDNYFLLKSIKEKLSLFNNLKVKHVACNGVELLEKLKQDHNVDVILMDIQMPEMDGIKATYIVKSKYPQIKVIMLTVYDDDENIMKSIQAGADGYILKETGYKEMESGLKEIIKGGAALTPIIASKALKLLRNPPSFNVQNEENPLSKREIQILEQTSKGLNYQEIAENLFISPSTVRKHIENIYRKLQVHNKMEAVKKAGSNNWID